jgi:hypothetical protein
MTVLTDFVEKYFDKDWDWGAGGLSSNKKITLQFIEKYIYKKWDFTVSGLSSNPVVTIDFVNKHIEKDWDFDWLDHIGFFKDYDKTLDYNKIFDEWNGDRLCFCRSREEHFSRCIDIKKDFQYINYNYGVFNLSSNKTVDIDFIEKILSQTQDNFHWGLNGLSSNSNLTCEFVEKYIHKNWYWGALGLSLNLPVNIKFIEKYKNRLDFGVCGLSSNKNLSLNTIKYYIDELDFNGLSKNPNITTKFINAHIDRNWSWVFLSCLDFENEEIFNSAKIIQAALHNWLWKPICKDGTYGINLRLGLRYLRKLNLEVLGTNTS